MINLAAMACNGESEKKVKNPYKKTKSAATMCPAFDTVVAMNSGPPIYILIVNTKLRGTMFLIRPKI